MCKESFITAITIFQVILYVDFFIIYIYLTLTLLDFIGELSLKHEKYKKTLKS